MSRYFLSFIVIFISYPLWSQGDISIGNWKDHLPYQQGTSVTQSENKIIYSTPLSLFTIDKEDLSVSFLSKIDGLSDIGIQKVRYDDFNDQLFVIYTNSNIDIIKKNNIINIPNIKFNTSIVGDKRVNDIYFKNESQSFISTAFGIVEFNNSDYNFGATILTGIGIAQVTALNEILYAVSAEGVYYIDQSSEPIIADFAKWNLLGPDEGLPDLYESNSIVTHKDIVYIGIENRIYKKKVSDFLWSIIHTENDLQIEFLKKSEDRLITIWRGEDFKSDILFFDDEDQWIRKGDNCAGIPVEAIRDNEGRIWYADLFTRIRSADGYNAPCIQTTYNSPFSEKVSDIVIKDNEVLIASGGVAENFNYLFTREGFYLNTDREWHNFNEIENNQIAGLDLLSVFRVAFHPSLPKMYAGSYWAGLLEYDKVDDSFLLYNKTNSTLRGAIGDPARERISGLAFDENENLWVATYNAPEPINVLSPDGRWLSFSVPSAGTLTDVVIDHNGYKWFTVHGSNGGLLVYDSGSSLQSTADDIFRFISRNNSELTTNVVLSMVVDLDGEVWVGTNEGPVIFDCGSGVFEEECRGVRRKVLQDSIAAFLLADQQVNVMEVDGADRKWIGTRNGLFVQSSQGDEQIAHFTTDNSPIMDNEIRALAYNGNNGVMWIGTNKGLITYRTSTTTGDRIHRDDRVYAFPNPVAPDYHGPIAIKGLIKDANVKITDINGLIVAELFALGGQAVWNGRDQQGREVSSGVYLVFSSDVNAFDNPDSFVTKIMVIR